MDEKPEGVDAFFQLVCYTDDLVNIKAGLHNTSITGGGDPEILTTLFAIAFKKLPFIKDCVIKALSQINNNGKDETN